LSKLAESVLRLSHYKDLNYIPSKV